MEYEIHPLKGVGEIEFGIPVKEVRRLLPGRFETFRRIEYPEHLRDKFPSDHFVDRGVFCYYDADGLLEAMEFVPPARPLLNGVNLLELSFPRAASVLTQLDPNAIRDMDSVTSDRLSLAIWTSNKPSEPISTFLTGRRGYYEDDI